MTENKLENELNECCNKIIESKNTCYIHDLQEIVTKLLQEKKILCRSAIINCLNKLNKLLPSRCLKDLLDKAIEIDDIEICHAYLNNVQMVNESDSVNCLKLFIKLNYDAKNKTIEINKNLENELNLVYGFQYDYGFLTKELKRLSSSEFIICLTHLKNLLKQNLCLNENSLNNSSNSNSSLEEEQQHEAMQTNCVNSSNVKLPDLEKITELLSCLIDAHFTHITLSNESQEIIADLLQIVESQVDAFSDLISVESLIKETRSRVNFQKKFNNQIGNYYIEVLKL